MRSSGQPAAQAPRRACFSAARARPLRRPYDGAGESVSFPHGLWRDHPRNFGVWRGGREPSPPAAITDRERGDMLDLVFLVLGLAVFAAFGGYAVLLRRL